MTDRVKIVRLYIQTLPLLLQSRGPEWEVYRNPVPDDAEVIGWELSHLSGILSLKVRSKTFPEIAEGMPIPVMEPTEFRRFES